MTDVTIKVEGLNKKFCRSLKRSMFYGTTDALMDMAGVSYDSQKLRKKEFWALKNINFELHRGETLGLIGQNGCGKTTLLRLINGIFPPDKGKIIIDGRIGALISVGAGFHPYMTGRENIYLNGTILGMTKTEINKKFDEIVEFAELGEFLDAPVATYSSGMTVRLGFAIAIHCEPDILLIDEILAVGDVGFQLKCFNKIGELRQKGVSILLVSHDLHNMSTYANKILLINKGEQIFWGDVSTGLSLYKKEFDIILHSEGEIEKVLTGTEEFKITDVIFNPDINENEIKLTSQSNLKYSIYYEAVRNFKEITIDTCIYLPLPGPHFLQSDNNTFNKVLSIEKGKGIIDVTIENISLNNITFHLFIAIWENNKKNLLFWWRKIPVRSIGNPLSTGWTHYNFSFQIFNETKTN